jgi:hypothetical protein
MNRISLILSTLVCLVISHTKLEAATVWFLDFKPQSSFLAGGTTTVDIVLREKRDLGDVSLLETFHISSANFRFSWSGTGTSSVVAGSLEGHTIQGGRFFDNGNSSYSGENVFLDTTNRFGTVEQFDLLAGADDPIGSPLNSLESSLRVGRFTVSGGSLGDTNFFTLADFDPSFADITLEDGTILDGIINYGTMNVATVPEPSSVALLGTLIGGFAVRHWRRKRMVKKLCLLADEPK